MTLDPLPCVALGMRDSAGQWQLALIALQGFQSPSLQTQNTPPTPLEEASMNTHLTSLVLGMTSWA